MSTPYIYYRVESGPVFDFCRDLRERRTTTGEKLSAWAKSKGATTFVPGWGSRVIGDTAINALVFEGEPTEPGWRLSRHRTSDGYDKWQPRKNTKDGKALIAEIKALEAIPSDDEFCEVFSFPHAISYKGNDVSSGICTLAYCSLTTCRIGWTSDTVYWVVLPDYAAIRADYEAKGYTVETPPWTAAEGMIPLTKAHYDLAFAQAEVDRLGKAA